MKKLLIFPFNGNALEALDCIGDAFEVIGFVDDTPAKQGKTSTGIRVFSRDAFAEFPEAMVLAVPGSPSSFLTRKEVISGLGLSRERFATIVHPRASVSPLASVGKNTLIMAGVVLTSNCTVGDHVCILPNSVIHHDSAVGNYTLMGSNVVVAGHTTIGENCYIGSGVSVINNIKVGNRVLVGIGSNVIRDLPAESRAVGNPAKLL